MAAVRCCWALAETMVAAAAASVIKIRAYILAHPECIYARRGPLEAAQVEAAVDVQYLSGRVIEQTVSNRTDCLGNIRTFAHSTLRKQAVRDLLVVNLFDL